MNETCTIYILNGSRTLLNPNRLFGDVLYVCVRACILNDTNILNIVNAHEFDSTIITHELQYHTGLVSRSQTIYIIGRCTYSYFEIDKLYRILLSRIVMYCFTPHYTFRFIQSQQKRSVAKFKIFTLGDK